MQRLFEASSEWIGQGVKLKKHKYSTTHLNQSQGRVMQNPIKVIQDTREFWFEFCNFSVRFSVAVILFVLYVQFWTWVSSH